jgi:general stress protein YciG
MDRSKQRDIASKGGKAAHQKGTAHEWTSEEAREAGRKGGMASHRRRQQQTEEGRSVDAVAIGSSDDMVGGVRDLGPSPSDRSQSDSYGEREASDRGDTSGSDRADRNEYH